MRLIDEALRELSQKPILILALARPTVNEIFPSLWDRRVQRVPLRPLGKRASERLVRQILGAETPAETVARSVDQAGGNALFLEELIRAVAETRGEALPDTVLAMLQARLGSLEGEARRILRAASIFGEHFRPSGVSALVADGTTMAQITRACATPVRQELLSLHESLHEDGEAAYLFRPALLRDARVYAADG